LGFGTWKLVLADDPSSRISFFEKSAPYYDSILDLITFGQYAKFLKRAVEILAPSKGERILDLCSGTGRAASWVATAVGDTGEVVGLDITESMVRVARKRYGGLKNLTFLQRDVTEPFGYENYFHGIFTSFALHELPEKYRPGVLEKSYLALKEGGRMVIADFNPQVSGKSKTISHIFFRFFERDNLNFFSFDQNETLRKVGFKEIRGFPVLAGILQIMLAHLTPIQPRN
jgi:demethylmenaquinone methyltransferase/2-methoxy-6-polyprenyl-1,4-benzoquinol methylase